MTEDRNTLMTVLKNQQKEMEQRQAEIEEMSDRMNAMYEATLRFEKESAERFALIAEAQKGARDANAHMEVNLQESKKIAEELAAKAKELQHKTQENPNRQGFSCFFFNGSSS